MDSLIAQRLSTRIVERGSFSAAAAELSVSRPAATAAIKDLERRLGARLLQRSTRHVRTTAEGEDYYRRWTAILAEIEDADRAVGGTIAGPLRVDVPGNLARKVLLPALPAFLARHPSLTVHIGEGERFVDLIREGVDCVVRAGELADSDLVARPLGTMEEITCASPSYLERHGMPASPDDLQGHFSVGFMSSRTGQVLPLEFLEGNSVVEKRLPLSVIVSAADTSAEAARLGLGLVQAPRYRFADDLASGALVEVLASYRPAPTPISILYPSSRHLSPRVRVFVDWLAETIGPQISRRV